MCIQREGGGREIAVNFATSSEKMKQEKKKKKKNRACVFVDCLNMTGWFS